jgi:hypothetical protein
MTREIDSSRNKLIVSGIVVSTFSVRNNRKRAKILAEIGPKLAQIPSTAMISALMRLGVSVP